MDKLKVVFGEKSRGVRLDRGALKLARNAWLKNNKVETRGTFSLNSLSEHL